MLVDRSPFCGRSTGGKVDEHVGQRTKGLRGWVALYLVVAGEKSGDKDWLDLPVMLVI